MNACRQLNEQIAIDNADDELWMVDAYRIIIF